MPRDAITLADVCEPCGGRGRDTSSASSPRMARGRLPREGVIVIVYDRCKAKYEVPQGGAL